MMRLPISARLLLSYVLVAVLPLSGLSLFYLSEFEKSLRTTVLETMASIADKKADQIDSYVFEQLAITRQIAHKQPIVNALNNFSHAFQNGGLKTAAYQKIDSQFRDALNESYSETQGFYDFILIDAAGNVVFTRAHESDLGSNLEQDRYRSSQLTQGFNLVSQTLQARLTRFAPYAPSNNRAAAFVLAPIMDNGAVIGALALQVDISKLESVVSDRIGLGESGETVAAQQDGDDAYYAVPLRHIPDAPFQYRVPLQDAALPMQQALSGAHDRGMIIDYVGIDCVAAWRYLPALRWGMVVKMDTREAMAPATRLREITYVALALFLLLSGAMAYFLGRRLTRPITALTKVAERIAQGDIAQRAPHGGGDELGRLAAAFNRMTDALSDARLNLEQKVEARTVELNSANQHLEAYVFDLKLAERKLLEQASLLDLAQDAIIVRDMNCVILYWNRGAETTYGWSDAAAHGQLMHQLLQTQFPEPLEDIQAKLLRDDHWEGELEHETRSGTHITVASRWALKHDEQGQPVAIMEISRDISERKRIEEAMQLYASVFANSGEAILISDAENKIVATNSAFQKLTGYSQEEVQGKSPRMLSAGKTEKPVYQKMWADLSSDGFWQGELWDKHKDGREYPKWMSITAVFNSKNEVINYIASFSDITEHKAAADKISHLAHHDTLTDLPNRFTLVERLMQAFSSAQRNNEQVAVMFIDLDRFKVINDTLGHHAGDQLLIQVAQRLKSCVRSSDIVARLGGDEFVVALSELDGSESVFQMADKILRTLGLPYSIEDNKLHSSPSIGIALFPGDGANVEEIMKNADVAMYHAKSRGRNNYQFFEAAMNQASFERMELENDMRIALEREEFVLHYQPKINVVSGRVSGVEALVRWQHPTKGLVAPFMFIPIAEETGLMLPLGEWVTRTACHQLRLWIAQGMTGVQMSINLSALQFRQKDLAQVVSSIVVAENIDPALLEFEVTESMAMENPQETIETMRILHSLGVKLAIDDFGTGHSSLSYLKRFPMNTLKLDRSFVKDIETDPSDAAICLATIGLAHNLGLEVVAEGVETEKQYEYLRRLGCDKIQGYYFSRPLPAAEAEAYIVATNASELFQEPPAVQAQVLIMDDDRLVADFLRHALEYLGHKPSSATNPAAGLDLLRHSPDAFKLIMLDMQMNGLPATDIVQTIRKINRYIPLAVVTSSSLDEVRKTLRPLEKDCNLLYGINYFILEKPLTIEEVDEVIRKTIV